MERTAVTDNKAIKALKCYQSTVVHTYRVSLKKRPIRIIIITFYL